MGCFMLILHFCTIVHPASLLINRFIQSFFFFFFFLMGSQVIKTLNSANKSGYSAGRLLTSRSCFIAHWPHLCSNPKQPQPLRSPQAQGRVWVTLPGVPVTAPCGTRA